MSQSAPKVRERDTMFELLADVVRTPEARSLLSGMRPAATQVVHGVGGSAKTLLVAALHQSRGRPSLYVTSDLEAARRAEMDLITWLGEDSVRMFPPRDLSPLGVIAQSGEIQAQRLLVLDTLLEQSPSLIVVPLEAALGLCPSPGRVSRNSLVISPGLELEPQGLAARLSAAGYGRVGLVEKPGDFSLRGGILDVFPPSRDEPYRIEFLGDEVASVRTFSPETQRSHRTVHEARLGPAREWVLTGEELGALAERVRNDVHETKRRLETQNRLEAARHLESRVRLDLERMETGTLEDVDAYAPLIEDGRPLIFDFLPGEAAVFLDEPARLEQASRSVRREQSERFAALLESGGLLPAQAAIGVSYAEMLERASRLTRTYLAQILRREPVRDLDNIVSLRYQPIPSFHGQWKDFQAELERWRRSGDRVLILSSSGEGVRGISRTLRDAGIGSADLFAPERVAGQVVVHRGILEGGFYLQGARLRVVTDAQIRGRAAKRRHRRVTAGLGEGVAQALSSYRELDVGDYVVHINHGVGIYLGVRSLEIEGVTRDYIFIKYAGEDRLYVPTDQVGLVQKYVGVEGQEPKVNRLAGTEWARAKNKARESLQKLAVDLLRLYARRQTLSGHRFPPDTAWQAEMEEGFHYEETPDQLKAVEDIKRDMEGSTPMDRLLCGDVGYGKTEVAVRAAFKAVTDGKQVAVLVPTTVLAQQHYHTFRERLAGYPVNVDLLSRFRSRTRQLKTIRDLRRGQVDIVIGTHRLLGSDVTFKDLGLLVIDEEHRFGVGHKERLKELRATVDVLVLTATPIPRTLNMALVGLRDMSVIDTPPEDRYPVQTYVVEYDEDLVRDAILRELARGGQVFYVHNRVQTIDLVVTRIRSMLPEARVGVAHGQMKEDNLERVMMDFLEGGHDILVSTTIIESGLDMPNVNTLIVEDADALGLAQLYQLRGRVGRSNRVAYAYFTYRAGHVISEQAEKRLEAIRDFTELGSGYKIALRDLEIRGAGNLLGPEQHGFIASVGFELYCRMLEEAIRTLKGETEAPRVETAVDVKVNAYLPDDYIPDARQKMALYHRIAGVSDPEEAPELEEELVDRYGALPEPVANLLLVAKVRSLASRLRCVWIGGDQAGGLQARFDNPTEPIRGAVESLDGRHPGVRVKTSARALLLDYRPGRRASLGDRRQPGSKENVALLQGLLDLLVLVSGRAAR
jgi:transcription-repair coupling factor (superfamily II helicase)